ncbi:uncharacterized protein HMPREF1541_03242 [Cyphellophora europaea CBS 101466]|uniref:Mediator of RNA polymerase II transcription subunit 4 n=1 Tax=Cyphellophora europaea (strain CBS 101466) TaxID=1220924 RepID=W2RXY7_CYPE1|nr:uncharacterized protein HMPREF1541_03242 [Cyphellophora europaea CBS 101466]ETN41307.1 hypothetical protein HMPREF1541_03242 [Cyphellophora europaea CBS 101466]
MTTTAQTYPPQSAASRALAPLNALSGALDTLQQTLQTSTTFSALPSTANTLLAADDSLSSALALLHQHQSNYARILSLRSEALALESQIKDIVRKARSLRREITDIHPTIDTDDAEADNAEQPEVDYQQLLNFAARIGRHNAVAKLEAEKEGETLKLEAVKARKKSEQLQQAQGTTQEAAADDNSTDATDKILREAAELSARSDAFHVYSRLPFPAPDMLRLGALGQLQKVREDEAGDPEGAVEREAERLVRETESVAPDEGMARRARDREEKDREAETRRQERAAAAAGPSQPQQGSRAESAESKPAREKKKLDLDFPGGDDSDED